MVSTTRAITTPGVRLNRKSLNPSPAYEPMRMLVGVPMSVLIPPTLEANTSGMSSAIGLRPNVSAIWIVIGAMSSMVVTLSSSAEATAVMMIRMVTNSHSLPRDRR